MLFYWLSVGFGFFPLRGSDRKPMKISKELVAGSTRHLSTCSSQGRYENHHRGGHAIVAGRPRGFIDIGPAGVTSKASKGTHVSGLVRASRASVAATRGFFRCHTDEPGNGTVVVCPQFAVPPVCRAPTKVMDERKKM